METIQKIRVIWVPKLLLMDSNPLNHHFNRLSLQQFNSKTHFTQPKINPIIH